MQKMAPTSSIARAASTEGAQTGNHGSALPAEAVVYLKTAAARYQLTVRLTVVDWLKLPFTPLIVKV